MSWSGAMTQFHANLRTAAAAVSPTIDAKLVRKGEPDTLNGDTIAFWMSGWQPSRTGADTFTKQHIERAVTVRIYIRASSRAAAADDALEDRLVAVEEEVVKQLLLDRDLNGNAIGLFIDGSEYAWEGLGDQLARTATFTAWLDLADTFTTSL